MPRRAIHNATVTLKLPFDIGVGAEITALRAAGIPVDALGNAERGFLFVRLGKAQGSQTNVFRWFAREVEQAPSWSCQGKAVGGRAAIGVRPLAQSK